jgi:hypothetical protein
MKQTYISKNPVMFAGGILLIALMISSTITYASGQSLGSSSQNNTSNNMTNQNITKASSSQFEGGSLNKTLNSPLRSTFAESASPSAISEEKKAQLEAAVEQTFNRPEIETTNKTIEGPTEGTQTGSPNVTTSTDIPTINNNASSILPTSTNENSLHRVSNMESNQSAIKVYTNESITAPASSISSVLEPSIANNGEIVFATANWIAAKSTDGGSTWRYISPVDDFKAFCCDQHIIFDPNRQIFVWFRQGIADDSGENIVKISISQDASNWWTYNIKPTDFDASWTNRWFDYPSLALGNDYLYLTTNVFNPNNEFINSVIARISLDDLRDAVPPAFSYYYDSSDRVFTFTPVQGAKDVMYWASTLSNSEMRIYAWAENQPWTQISRADVAIPAWTPASTIGMSCPSIGGNDMCRRADSRITAGWMSGNDTIGFFWNADRGGQSVHGATFPWPYINAATFNVNNMSYQGRPYLWSPDFAFLYGSGSTNNRGDVGIEITYGGGDRYPSLAAGIADSISGNPPPWDLTTLMVGTNAPASNEWGDYITTRTYNGSGDSWISVGFTLQGCSADSCIEPRYFVFGRQNNDTSITPSVTSATTEEIAKDNKNILYIINKIEDDQKNLN